MKHPDQGQHRIPQVYLRQWSFRDLKSNAEKLCVTKRGDPVTHYKYVKSFTKETNLFDATLLDDGHERFFDKKCIAVENNYNDIIRALSCGQFDDQIRVYLIEFISNIFVRQRNTFDFFLGVVQQPDLFDKFLNEISILDRDQPAEILKAVFKEMAFDLDYSLESKTSAFLIQAWKHFGIALDRFNCILLKAPDNYYWHTTDNPVIVKSMCRDGWIIGGDAEIYFPISKNHLVYMYINDAVRNPAFAGLTNECISEISFELMDDITRNTIIESPADYLIMGEDHGYYDASSDMKVDKFVPVEFLKNRKQ